MIDDMLFKRMNKVHVLTTAAALGIKYQPKAGTSAGSFPCPVCGTDKRHNERKRGAAGLTENGMGWHCHACQAKGASAMLVAHTIGNGRFTPDVIDFCKSLVGLPTSRDIVHAVPLQHKPPEPEQKYPDARWLRQVWDSCKPVTEDKQVSDWLRAKRIDVDMVARDNLARALPIKSDLCPTWAYDGNRLIVPLRDHNGVARNIKARRVDGGKERKSVSIKDGRCRGLCFYDSRLPTAAEVFLVEGEKKYLQMMSMSSPTDAVIGIGSGLYTPELIERIHRGAHIYIITDADSHKASNGETQEAGARYATEIINMLDRDRLKRVHLWSSFEIVKVEDRYKVQVRREFTQEQLRKGA